MMRFSLLVLILAQLLFKAAPASADGDLLEKLEGSFGRASRFSLDNGMICIVAEDPSAPVVSIQIWVGTGSAHEQEYFGAGLSHAIEHMIFKGTPSRKPGEITRDISDAGGFVNAYTTLDRTVFFADLPSESWKTGLEVLADAAMNASFPEAEWELERQVIIREMAMNRDNPDRELSRALWDTLFSVHPYRAPVIGYEDVFNTITRDDLELFFKRHYSPDNMIAVIAGDIRRTDAEKALHAAFAGFKRQRGAPTALPSEPAQISPREARRYGPYELGRMTVGYHTVQLEHPDAPALDVLAEIAGGGRSSKLEQRLKEKERLARSVSAFSFTPKEPGVFAMTAAFEPEQEQALIASLLDEVQDWKDKGFSDSEVKKAKRAMLASVVSELKTAHGYAAALASGEFYARDPLFSPRYLKRLEAVTPESVQAAARRYLSEENRSTVLLLPESFAASDKEPPAAFVSSEVSRMETRNGLIVLTREDNRLPLVSFCVAFTGGISQEHENNNGITRFMSEMLTRGTAKRSSFEIAETVESLGGRLSAFSGNDSFGLTAECFTRDAELFMNILSDCVLNPAFSEDEIVKQKAVQLASIARQQESPLFKGMQALKRLLFPNHPYRFSPEGSKESVGPISRDDLQAFHKKLVVSGNTVFAVFGDISTGTGRQLAERFFQKLPEGVKPALECSFAEPVLPELVKTREPRRQTIVIAGFPGITRIDPLYDALAVLQNSMSGLSSDLLTAIRDERGLAYYGGAAFQSGIEPGLFALYAGTKEEAVEEVLTLFEAEISRLTKQGLRPDELDRARAQIISAHKHKLQVNSEVAMECALNELFGLGCSYSFTLEERMLSLTQDQVKEAANRVLRADRKAVSIVLPEAADASSPGE